MLGVAVVVVVVEGVVVGSEDVDSTFLASPAPSIITLPRISIFESTSPPRG